MHGDRPVTKCNQSHRRTRHIDQFKTLRTRALKIFWVLMDQGMFALSNFVINILFARWLVPDAYGWYALSFSGCLLITYIHWGAVLEPLLVQSAKVQLSRRRSYVASLARVHLVLLGGAVMLAAVCCAIASIWFATNVCLAIVGALVGAVAINTLTTGRRLCAIFVSAKLSSMIGMAYLAGSILTGLLIHTFWTVGWFDIWLVVGGWSLVGAVATFRLTYNHTEPGLKYPISEILEFARRYVHWGLGSSVCGWMQMEGLYMILARFVGLEAVAETRAVFNLAAPLFQLNFAAHLSAIVQFSADGNTGSKRNIWRIVALYSSIAAVLFPVLHHYSAWLVNFVYSGRYVDGAWQLPLYCLGLCMNVLDSIISSVFKASGRLSIGYASVYVSAAVVLIVGLILIPMQRTLVYTWVIECGIALCISLTLRMRARA